MHRNRLFHVRNLRVPMHRPTIEGGEDGGASVLCFLEKPNSSRNSTWKTRGSRGMVGSQGFTWRKCSHSSPCPEIEGPGREAAEVTLSFEEEHNVHMVMFSQWGHKPSIKDVSAWAWPKHWKQRSWLSEGDINRLHPEGHGWKAMMENTQSAVHLLF